MDNVEDIYPLSSLQEGILFHVLKDRQPGLYVQQISCDLRGTLDLSRLKAAWGHVIQRHTALRTSFHWEEVDTPLQVVHNTVTPPWHEHDWCALGEEIVACQWQRLWKRDRQTSLDLTDAPVMRFTLVQTQEDVWRFLWTFHHILADGWSAAQVLRQVFIHYDTGGKCAADVESPPPYSAYIAHLQQFDRTRAEAYWRRTLEGIAAPTTLPIRDRSHGINATIQTIFTFSVAQTEAINAFARQHHITPSTFFQGLWAILLHLYTGDRDVLYGVTVSGRPPALRGVEKMVGLFINSLPLRIAVDETATANEIMRNAGRAFSSLLEYEHSPLVDVQQWSPVAPGTPLFESLLVFENYPSSDAPLSSQVNVSDLHYVEESNYPLALLVVPEEALRIIFIHDPDTFSVSALLRLGRHLSGLAEQITGTPQVALPDLRLLDPDSPFRLETRSDAPALASEQCWLQSFDIQVDRTPDRPAIVCGDQQHSYRELDRRANQVAHYIQAHCPDGENPLIACCFERSATMVLAMLGAHKAGAAYVPIDAHYPAERIRAMLADAAPVLLLHGPELDALDMVSATPRVLVDTDGTAFADQPDTAPAVRPKPADLAYLIYTSGSTGTPRGVAISHANLAYSTFARLQYYEEPVQSFLMPSSFSFDSSVAGIYWTLSDGGTLYLPEEQYAHDPEHLAAQIAEQGISHLLCVPSLHQVLLRYGRRDLTSLRVVIVAGEPCPPSLVESHYSQLPATRLFNEYGPSECTVWCTVHPCKQGAKTDTVPIGKVIPGTSAFVLDGQHRLLPPGIPGELGVAGPGVSRGYHGDDALTTSRFVSLTLPDQSTVRIYKTGDRVRQDDDGTLAFLGRNDGQLKIRGFRVEPGEVESVLAAHDEVLEVAITTALSTPDLEGQDVPSEDALLRALSTLDPGLAEALLHDVEVQGTAPTSPPPATAAPMSPKPDASDGAAHTVSTPDFNATVELRNSHFIAPPRESQREWMLRQVMREVSDDLNHLNAIASRFVSGDPRGFEAFDIHDTALSAEDIMEDWQVPLMRAMAAGVGETGGDILEIGFGRGVAGEFVQTHTVRSHTIIEANAHSIETYFKPFAAKYPERDIRSVHGMWQDTIGDLGTFDGILFHAFPLDEEDFIENIVQSVTFAAHFFPFAAKHLNPGGVFTYLTTEVDSLGRGHQRQLFEHFREIRSQVMPVQVPENTRDSWWAETMVVVNAIK